MGSSTGYAEVCYQRQACAHGFALDLCGNPTKGPDLFSSCNAVLDQIVCDTGSSYLLARVPAECDGLLICDGGPCLR
jgi:hypothetical protein